MHGNNEIGNITDLHRVGELCKAHKAFFHSDTVQTLGHFPLALREIPVDAIVGAAHKFHGPKGVGLLYINKASKITPFITGGSQERNMRGGTENVYGIVGLAKALEVAVSGMQAHRDHILSLKKRMAEKIKALLPEATFNGASGQLDQSLYTVLNVNLPPHEANELLLFNLDLNHISVSGGSACSSGAGTGSHVIRALHPGQFNGTLRFSFSKYNTEDEIDYAVTTLAAQFEARHA
jgi:cysteine desulfurase